jgi:transposase
MQTYAGIDLHSSNNYLGIIDSNDKRLFGQRLPNNMDAIQSALKPFQKDLAGIVVESTFNWYWLVDGLQSLDYCVHLSNPSATKQYEGIKHTDDQSDAFWLVQMLRLGILKEGYIYPKAQRALRDLIRRRLLFVRQRTAHILSLQSMLTRNLGTTFPSNEVKRLKVDDADQLFDDSHLNFMVKTHIDAIRYLKNTVRQIERQVLSQLQLKEEYKILTTIPGVGIILGLTIMLEVDDFGRFPKAGNYASYCRCVKSVKLSNTKKKGTGNRKNGNKYLSWAYVEAAHFIIRHCPEANRFYQRKKAKTNGAVATKALAHKLARASYYMVRNQIPFDKDKLFK